MATQNSSFYNSAGVFIDAFDYGCVGDGVTDDTAAVAAAISAASTAGGGIVFFRAGTYKVNRNAAAANLASNVRIVGSGGVTVFTNAGMVGTGNENYNIFSGTSLSNLSFENFKVSGTCAMNLDSCTNIRLENIYVDGYISATSYSNKGVYLHKCSNVSVSNCSFKDLEFATYYSGDGTTQTSDVSELGNKFWNTIAPPVQVFPVGTYIYYGRRVSISGNSYTNIVSSTPGGTTGTGMGYGIYEGDGETYDLTITGNTAYCSRGDVGRMIGIMIASAESATVTGNAISCAAGLATSGGLFWGIFSNPSTSAACKHTIANNQITGMTLSGAGGIAFSPSAIGAVNRAIKIDGNNITYGRIYCDLNQTNLTTATKIVISNNAITAAVATSGAIYVVGVSSAPPSFGVKITGNVISKAAGAGIQLSSSTKSHISDNIIEDCNTANDSGEILGAGIVFTSFAFGGLIAGNTIRNNPGGSGHTKYGINLFSSTQMFKFQLTGNIFDGIETGNVRQGYTAASTAFDWSAGEAHESATRSNLYRCTTTSSPTLSANASNGGGTTITCSSTAGMLAGDVVWLLKNNTTFWSAAGWEDAANWHQTTVDSVTNGTDFVVTDAIPAGDGTYVAGTAVIKTLRWATVY